MGMPVISTCHGDIPNVVAPGKSALLVPERDSGALAGALAYLVENPGLWEQMGRNGREFVEKFHNMDNEVLALEDKYFVLLGYPRARA